MFTKFADAMGRSKRDRDYAIIEKDGQYLHIELARAGLARIHGFQEVSDDMPSEGTMRMRLNSAETEAKAAKRGAWGGNSWSGSSGGSTGSSFDTTPVGSITITRSITILDVNDASRALGVLRAGAVIKVLSEESPTLYRIQFKAGDEDREGLCQKSDL